MSFGRAPTVVLRFDHLDAAPNVGEVALHASDRFAIGVPSARVAADLGAQAADLGLEVFDPRFEATDAHVESLETHFKSLETHFESVETHFESLDARFERGEASVDTPKHRLDRVETLVVGVKAFLDERELACDGVANVDQNFENFIGCGGHLRLHRFHVGAFIATSVADGEGRRRDHVLDGAVRGPGAP